jgi:hypothetical protein
MDDPELVLEVRNINARLTRVEQYLPPLATRDDVKAAFAPLATKEELSAAIAPLATREELLSAIASLPTREEMHAAIGAAGEAARRHATVLFESLKDDTRLIVEHLLVVSSRVDELARR